MSSHKSGIRDISMFDLSANAGRTGSDISTRNLLLKREDGNSYDDNDLKADNMSEGWPTAAQAAKITPYTIVSTIIVDALLLALSMAFLAFALSVAHYDQARTVDHPQVKILLLAVSRVAPSVFPLLFAAVVGRVTHAVLLWRLEKGACIGTLDLLAGSTSLTSTLTSQLQLRKISIISVILLLIWSLSPLGGQASIQQLGFGKNTTETYPTLTYLQPRSTGNMYSLDFETISNLQYANALFLAALLAPVETRNSTLDLWNNVKIPYVEVYENSSNADAEGWYNVSGTQPVYSSLIGVPVTGYKQVANASMTFLMETSYFHLDCPKQGNGNIPVYGSTFSGPGGHFSLNYAANCGDDIPTSPGSASSNYATSFKGQSGYLGNTSCDLPTGATKSPLTNDLNLTTPRNFTLYNGWTNSSTFCLLTNTSVEADIQCSSDTACKARRIRRSRKTITNAASTVLDLGGGIYGDMYPNGNWPFLLAAFLNTLGGIGRVAAAPQAYVVDPDQFLALSYGSKPPSPELFAIRQGQLMNAFWTCLSNYEYLSIATNDKPEPFSTTLNGGENATTSQTNGTTIRTFEIITCHYGWMYTLAIASSVLIATCLVHPIIRLLLSRAPELIFNVSSLAVRDNPYMDIPDTGTALDGSDRARLLQNHKVRFGDIKGDNNVGHLAIASLDSKALGGVRAVRKGRLYE